MEYDTFKAVVKAVYPTVLVVAVLLVVATNAQADWWDFWNWDWSWIWDVSLGGDANDVPTEN